MAIDISQLTEERPKQEALQSDLRRLVSKANTTHDVPEELLPSVAIYLDSILNTLDIYAEGVGISLSEKRIRDDLVGLYLAAMNQQDPVRSLHVIDRILYQALETRDSQFVQEAQSRHSPHPLPRPCLRLFTIEFNMAHGGSVPDQYQSLDFAQRVVYELIGPSYVSQTELLLR